jgi:hypothetical protein
MMTTSDDKTLPGHAARGETAPAATEGVDAAADAKQAAA